MEEWRRKNKAQDLLLEERKIQIGAKSVRKEGHFQALKLVKSAQGSFILTALV